MNKECFEYLYKKYLGQIIRYINIQYKIDIGASEDVAHEVFKTLWEKREDVYYENDKMMLSWLYKTAKRKSLECIKHEGKFPIDSDCDPEEIPNEFSAEYEDLIHTEGFRSVDEKYQNYLSEIKEHLTENEQALFVLVVEEKLDAKEAASMLNISDINFRVRWSRLRNKLKPMVKKMIEN